MIKKPLFLITGASGSGKTAVIPYLYKVCFELIFIDLDSLHGVLTEWPLIKNVWIYVANQIALNNRLTVISGTFLAIAIKGYINNILGSRL